MNDRQTDDLQNAVIYEGADLEALLVLENYAQWIVDCFRPHLSGRVIEFGAGLGTISHRLRPHVATLDLVEPSSTLIAPLRDRFADDDAVSVVHDTLENQVGRQADGSLDAVIMVNVLEHIEDDAGALREFQRMLSPGGHLLIFVPALSALFSELDRIHGHYRRYHRAPLRRLVEAAGFDIVRLDYFDFVGMFAWFLMNRALGKTEFDERLVRLYDRVVVPVMRPLEGLIPPPLGKNLLLVARRPANGT